MLNIVISILGILITILLIVGIHESGHFFVAKLLGIKVLRFSIGFGKPLLKWQDKKGTEYTISAIPLGGYVKMLDETEDVVPANERHYAFNNQPYLKKMAVIAAGPLSNLIFAFLIYWALFMVGFTSIAPIIGKVEPHSIAAEAKVIPQQQIISVDGKPTHNWISVIVDLLSRSGDTDYLKIQTKDQQTQQTQIYLLNLAHWHMEDLKPDPLASLGITPFEPEIPAVIYEILPDSPAAHAGLQVGDKITAIQHQPIADYFAAADLIVKHPKENLVFTIQRQQKTLDIPVTIGSKSNGFFSQRGYLGISPHIELPKNLLRHNKYGAIESLSHAWADVSTFSRLNFIILGKMVTGKISLKSLGGPITIFQSAGTALNNGLIAFVSFLAFLSISIGIINIIPIPGLDGGHLLLQTIEAITRHPISQKTQLLAFRLGLIFLLLIMFQSLINDILRL